MQIRQGCHELHRNLYQTMKKRKQLYWDMKFQSYWTVLLSFGRKDGKQNA